MTDTIVAVATPPGQGAIAVLRLSGPEALKVARQTLRSKDLQPRSATLGQITDEEGEIVDEVLATFFPGPASYTGEDLVEISCHGGTVVTQAVFQTLLKAGARPAEPGEFTQRAFLNEKMDLTQAEAVMDLIVAQTGLARRAALSQLRGKLGQQIENLRGELIQILAHVEAYIDFPDEDIDPETGEQLRSRLQNLLQEIETLASTANEGRILREGVRTVLCGRPNAGKSSLLNQLTGFDRAIVASQEGTTRDTIEETINLRGYPLRLVDTAGLRNAGDSIEQEGVSRSNHEISQAELVLEVIDGSVAPPGGNSLVEPSEHAIHLQILNKEDLGLHAQWRDSAPQLPVVSCETGNGLDALKDRIIAELFHDQRPHGDLSLTVNSRHLEALRHASARLLEAATALSENREPELMAVDLHSALQALGEIVGQTDIDEILGEIFQSFCIGK